jgi:hypothetical protein
MFYLIKLTIERKEKRCFNGFEEAQIDFAPTYKYDIGTNVYDTRYCFMIYKVKRRDVPVGVIVFYGNEIHYKIQIGV